ncbi:DUF262 domain-containing protein [Chitinophaga arvensicola]|uniref:GmrSD restriction endonucleases N-terminal domain-containing protein n=1 Tax=Chitinophaga arvensicola TaxID=29529 RepID=A0A1I0S7A3_9BACT|nr:DUF262 domain-containing protein [Chitinophaga arvensicola]SEW51618.1 Protein of unknown function DUF262 [Chitinophaga arvensicola]
MKAIKEIFQNAVYRIPDYQRGYSWETVHLEDFWQDLRNLQKDHIHYTGMISVELVEDNEYRSWSNDLWLIEVKRDSPFFIVDGQQRLTTIVILLSVLVHHMEDGELLSFDSKSGIIEKYLYIKNPKTNSKSYLFGYHKDNPSYDYLKIEIFEQFDEGDIHNLEKTSYTNNLLNAKKFFHEKIHLMTHEERENLYTKVTQNLVFDFKPLEKQLDIFIVFETMNNRGKPLSNLEKLKNRLIYLCSLLNVDNCEKRELRDSINDRWKVVYRYLGLTADRRMDDDTFLQTHWVMYSRYDRREPEFYAKDIFDRVFTPHNVVDEKVDIGQLRGYIDSIADAVKCCFVMYNPHHKECKELGWSYEVLEWLKKLNRLGFKSFGPLVLASLMKERDNKVLVDFLSSVEAYIFLLYNVSFRRSNTGSYHFSARASDLYNGRLKTTDLIADLHLWTYGNNDVKGYFAIENFFAFLNDNFKDPNRNGYAEWKHLRYFLFEFELGAGGDLIYDSKWSELNAIDFVLPKNPVLSCWKSHDWASKSLQHYPACSLGNFILVPKGKVFKEEACFEEKREVLKNIAVNVDNVVNERTWDFNLIEIRGKALLDFMEKRWNIQIGSDDYKRRLLFLDQFPSF